MTPKQMRAAKYKEATKSYQEYLKYIHKQYCRGLISVYDYTVERNENERKYIQVVAEINLEIKIEKEQNERV